MEIRDMSLIYEGQLQTDKDNRKRGCRLSHMLINQFPVVHIYHTLSQKTKTTILGKTFNKNRN